MSATNQPTDLKEDTDEQPIEPQVFLDEEDEEPQELVDTFASLNANTAEMWLKEASSTQAVAKDLIMGGVCTRFIVIGAETQTSGHGTNQRKWLSPPGNLYLTVAVHESELIPSRPHLLPLEVGVVVAKVIASFVEPVPVHIKWPNDTLINNEKVAGIIIEACEDYKLIGIGVNAYVAPSVDDGGRKASCIKAHTEKTDFTAADVGEAIVVLLKERLKTLHEASPQDLLNEWSAYVDWKTVVTVRDSGEQCMPLGVDPSGALRVRMLKDNTETLLSAQYLA